MWTDTHLKIPNEQTEEVSSIQSPPSLGFKKIIEKTLEATRYQSYKALDRVIIRDKKPERI